MHLTESPAPLRAHRPDVPSALEAVVTRALRRRPEDRYRNAGEILDVLANLHNVDTRRAEDVADRPIRSITMGANAHIWRFIGLVAACYVTLVGAIIAATVVLR